MHLTALTFKLMDCFHITKSQEPTLYITESTKKLDDSSLFLYIKQDPFSPLHDVVPHTKHVPSIIDPNIIGPGIMPSVLIKTHCNPIASGRWRGGKHLKFINC